MEKKNYVIKKRNVYYVQNMGTTNEEAEWTAKISKAHHMTKADAEWLNEFASYGEVVIDKYTPE